jgi:CRP/FNR family transcriptional regulator, cyclic AMP receptor protein
VELSLSGQLADVTGLAAAVRRNKTGEPRRLSAGTWQVLSEVLVRRTAAATTCLIREGESERHVYFVESGLLRVFRSDVPDRLQLGVIGAGSVAGEGGFFSPLVRNASVEAIQATVVWELSLDGFEAIAERTPQHALAVALYLGAVLTARMLSPAGRLSVT